MKFHKNLVFFDVLGSKFQKNLEFSKIPKLKKNYQLAQIFLEFWNFGKLEVFWNFGKFKKPRLFWNFGRKPLKTMCFLGICYEIPKKPLVVWCFGIKFQTNLGFFLNFPKFQKNLEFSKIPKIFGQVDNIFGILENSRFFGIWFHKVEKHSSFAKNLKK